MERCRGHWLLMVVAEGRGSVIQAVPWSCDRAKVSKQQDGGGGENGDPHLLAHKNVLDSRNFVVGALSASGVAICATNVSPPH